MIGRSIAYHAAAGRLVERAEAMVVRQELCIARLRMCGASTAAAEEILVHLRQHLAAA
jgi:hypothetical protein